MRRLDMIFKTTEGKTAKISVDHAKENLTKEEIQKAMESIMSKNIFSVSSGELVGVHQAKIVTTEVEEMIV
ncbi:DUF2922 domain-containing protein [Inediibacterium massiliense]|uniref:DUF2922 domain-containing protein n=1 Tax=Inediibacterium massiliense TaxID=1658111 RepID=UPI0006B41F96|nr:DUF2922 domain-containing protein [Inediibacterium massiliense]